MIRHGSHLAYRPDIDGLRALAILAVLGFHTFPQIVRGGFVGVDVFFVISGYLITGIIFKSLTAGRFSLREFYFRRVRRIFPALALVMAACLAIGWFVLVQDEYMQLSRHVAAASAFSLNFVLWREAGYFDTAGALKPLLHIWSLGVEEQFYIVWPLLLWVAWSSRINLRWFMFGIVAVSFAYSVRTAETDVVAAFYSPLSRFWELAIGCWLALHASSAPGHAGERRAIVSNLMALLGVLLIAVAVAFIRSDSAFPGWRALFPTLGSGLLIAAGPQPWINRRILAHGVLVWIGLISYPLYLWHWPLLAFGRIQSSTPLSAGVRIGLVLSSVVLAWLTFKVIEAPARRGRTAMALGLAGAMAVVFSVSVFTYEKSGFPDRFLAALRPYATYSFAPGTNARPKKCWLGTEQSYRQYAPECLDDAPERAHLPLMFAWGDSYAARLYVGLHDVLGSQYRVAQYTRDGCAPLPRPESAPLCLEGNRFILDKIAESKPAIVVLFGNWSVYTSSWAPGSETSKELLSTIASLQRLHVPRIIVVGPAPGWGGALHRIVYSRAMNDRRHRIPLRLSDDVDPQYAAKEADFRLSLRGQAVSYVSVRDLMCNADGCVTHVDGSGPDHLVTFDDGHFTPAGAAYVARRLLQ